MISLQIPLETIQKVTSSDSATTQGVLMGGVLLLLIVVYYLYKSNQATVKDFMSKMELINIERMEESKAVQEMLLKLNNQYFEAIQILKSKK